MARRSSIAVYASAACSSGSSRSNTFPGSITRLSTLSSSSGRYCAHGGGSAFDPDVAEEHLAHRELDAVGHADDADHSARTDRTHGLGHRLRGADGLAHGVGPDALGELEDRRHPVVATLRDDVGGPELARDPLS